MSMKQLKYNVDSEAKKHNKKHSTYFVTYHIMSISTEP